MSFGPSAVEGEAQQYRQAFGASLPGVMNQGMGWMNQGVGQLDAVNGDIRNYISGIGKDPMSKGLSTYLSGIMDGSNKATQGQFTGASATDLAMRGQGFAQQFGSDLGGLALQQKNMQTVADRLSSTSQNPFAQLTAQATEDAAFQNAQGRMQLQSQLASQGLDGGSGTGAAALAALQFNTNKSVADAARQNAVQGAQFQQQGLGMAGGIYGQLAGLDLQRAQTQAQLGLQGYQADMQNAGRLDAVNMANAQGQTQASLQNAAMQNNWMQSGLQGQLGMLQNQQAQQMAGYGMLSQNAGQLMNMGSNMWGQGFAGQQNYMNMLNQSAMQNAQGRGQMWGGLLQGGLGLAGTILGGPIGGALGTALGGMFKK